MSTEVNLPGGVSNELKDKIKEARKEIVGNLKNPPSIQELSRKVGTNECDLKKHFKEMFNQTIYGYVREQKIKMARELLKSSDKSISEIAGELGYKHATHFTAAFKKQTGLLPKQLRKGADYPKNNPLFV